MCFNFSYNKRFIVIYFAIIIIVLFGFSFKVENKCFAENTTSTNELEQEFESSIDEIMNDIDTNLLDDYIDYDFDLNFFNGNSFKDLVKNILQGNYFDEYDSLFDYLSKFLKSNVKQFTSVFILMISIILIYEIFKTFCADKFFEIKKIIKSIISLMLIMIIISIIKDLSGDVLSVVKKIFSFTEVLFPILLNLILLSGASGTYSVYGSLSVFLLNTASYIFIYILLPISISILVLSLVGAIFSNKRFEKTISVFKLIFKYLVILLFSVFGIFSMVNLVTAGTQDGVSMKLTKFAIKNYIPILGGYISEGFDFVHAGAVLLKNAFGVSSLFILFFIVIKPLIVYFSYLILFKILSLVVSFVSSESFSDIFDNVSKSLEYFIGVLIGVFIIMFVFIYLLIFSVSVV